jgi:hypothetical protein
LEDVGIGGIITLKCIVKKYVMKVWTGFILARRRADWQALTKTILNPVFHKR